MKLDIFFLFFKLKLPTIYRQTSRLSLQWEADCRLCALVFYSKMSLLYTVTKIAGLNEVESTFAFVFNNFFRTKEMIK